MGVTQKQAINAVVISNNVYENYYVEYMNIAYIFFNIHETQALLFITPCLRLRDSLHNSSHNFFPQKEYNLLNI